MKSRVPVILFSLLLLASCASTDTRIVPGDRLVPADVPNIRSVTLLDGKIINFNSNLGWYNYQRAYVEGVTLEEEHDTIPVSKIKVALLSETNPNTVASIFAAIGLMALAFTIAIVVYITQTANRSGCIVILAGLISAASIFGAVLILIQP